MKSLLPRARSRALIPFPFPFIRLPRRLSFSQLTKKKLGTLFFCSFLYRCFARLHGETQKLARYTFFFGGNVACVPVHFFCRCRSFSPWWQVAFPLFLTAALKLLCFSSNEIGLLCFFFSRSNSFSVIQTLKLSGKKESDFVTKRPGNCAGAWNAKFHPGLHETVGARTDVPRKDDFLRTQISWMHGLLNFLTRGAPRSSLRARESSAIISRKEFWVIFPSPNSFQSRRLPPGLGFNFT